MRSHKIAAHAQRLCNPVSRRIIRTGNYSSGDSSLSIGLQRLNARILLSRLDSRAQLFSEPAACGSGEVLHCVDSVADVLAARPPPVAGATQAVRLAAACGYISPVELMDAFRALAGLGR